MNKKILTTAFTIAVITTANAQVLNKSTLCKKWYLHHYEYLWKKYQPEAKEKNDYVIFKADMTYVSVDEGEKSTGKWSYNAKGKYILMANQKGESLKLEVDVLNSKEFVFKIDDAELKGLEIHYSSKPNNK